MRRALGQTLERLVAQSSERHPLGPRVWPGRERVDSTRNELGELAWRLRVEQHLDPRGLARVSRLLSDGGGPLFWSRSHEDLRATVREAITALESSPDQPRARETR